ADPFVHRKLRQIGNQVDYLQHGVEYVSQRLEEGSLSKEVLYENYPYWAQTLITTEKSKKKVEEYFSAFTKELSHPLYILNTQEIKEILESGSRKIEEESCVYPDSWENNLDQSVFISWQKEMAEQAQEAKSERNSIQLKLDGVKKLSHFVWEYYDTYPLEDYRQIQEKIRKLSEELRSINERLIIEEEARQKLEQEEKNIADFFRSSAEEKPMLGKKLEQVKEYQNVQKAMLQQQAMSREMKTEFDQLLSSLHRLKKQIGEVEGRIKESEEASRECSEEIRHIQSSELYERVYQKEATYSEMAFEVMKERLRNLEDQLAGFSRKAKDVENRIRDFQKREQKLRKDIDWCHKKAKYPIEPKELMSDEAKENLLKAWKSEEEEVDSLRKQLAVVEKEKEKLLVEKRIFMEEVIEKYQIVFEFTNDLHLEKAKIEEEMKELRKVKKNLEERRVELDKRLALLSETGNKLRIEDAKHDFVSLAIDTFDPNNYLSFSYEPAPFMNKVSKGLEEKKEKLESRNQVIQKEKERYIDYCSRNIHEYKLKDMAVKGVEKNTNYNDLLDFKRRMEEILNRNIKVAEDDRRESDEELQVFIIHLLTYAKNVLMEIDGIQKKTKIQVEEETKQIFLFDIPTWEELAAKEQLRKYIDRTVSDYDQEAQLKGEDKEALHQFIEQRLSVKNLILCVLGDRSIKIKCRKVTNDLKINQAPMSWESSNKWSGGEKWSKNMTLFLSILNYLAEKKQFSVKHLKKHRTVILDNPFGKASSQHVLDPVFFVADHLGFQIITVTAHAEGKFVTDYFPVVYSGKLRESMDADKQIMELSRSLNTAYLHMNSPDSMSNL
ncbi:MAG: hypothetical protein JW708_06590, partial [Vallitaleaceae bacterium]|nr:hypothetical protein [Vallitaleaceae bacterium]